MGGFRCHFSVLTQSAAEADFNHLSRLEKANFFSLSLYSNVDY